MADYNRQPSEFEENIIQVNRVSKKTKGGNKIGFSVLAVVGDKKGRVGVGLGKAPDVASAIRKGVSVAKKNLVTVPIVNGTIPFGTYIKLGAARILLKPAPAGSGVIAGGAVRSVVSAAGIHNISSKVLGTGNKISNVYGAIEALKRIAKMHDKRQNAKVSAKG
jgi:small subunit ribosomal protein S5